ncbi:MAG: hypothetical protein WA131_09235 [Desulfitobacteriaceae bacterium]
MKIGRKANSVLTITFSIITMILGALFLFGFIISIDVVMLFLGVTQLFGGLSQINLAQEMNSKGKNKGNKIVGGFSVILGIVIIIAAIIKIIL